MGVTVSIGLAPNRLLAKIAAGRDKPRGFAVIGAAEAASLLAPEPVRLLPGIGPALARKLAGQGITLLGHLQALNEREARRQLGDDGPVAGPPRPRRGRRAGRSGARDQVDQRRDHLRHRSDARRPIWRPISGGCRRSLRGG